MLLRSAGAIELLTRGQPLHCSSIITPRRSSVYEQHWHTLTSVLTESCRNYEIYATQVHALHWWEIEFLMNGKFENVLVFKANNKL